MDFSPIIRKKIRIMDVRIFWNEPIELKEYLVKNSDNVRDIERTVGNILRPLHWMDHEIYTAKVLDP